MSGHSLEREARGYIRERRAIRRPQAVPYHATWTEHARLTAEVVLDTLVLLVLLFGVPFLLLMIGGGL